MASSQGSSLSRCGAIARLFFKLGVIGFGGPAAHIALMDEEVVKRRRWLTREHFLDLLGATNLIPGPNSTEMAIHVGFSYGGWPGLVVAGVCFVLPAVVLTGLLAWVYVEFGTVPAIAPLLYGIKPAVLAIIAAALWRLGKKAVKSRPLGIVAAAVIPLLLWGVNEVLALLIGGVVGMVWLRQPPTPPTEKTASLWVAAAHGLALTTRSELVQAAAATTGATLGQIALVFLKVGAVLFGSGYVLIAFLEGELVGRGWLTQTELLDAIAIGQFTPGPVLSTATFIGYLMAGVPGAVVATVGIFLPSFGFVALLNPLIPKLRQSPWAAAFLDAVNASSVALMAVVTVRLAGLTLWGDAIALAIVLLAAVAIFRFKIGPVWVVLGGAAVGLLSQWV
ncbi:chromate efflux transporter [Spirulina major CS-329]|uniref:chromate efflux transporter n=1 Tax=Spirulina TaxID=1154 RepID=UPI0023305A1C|nr:MULTISPECIES: chromate efflux transporter [Spirulina]MDB9494086.1 chromate efflux transporter [Spirulina subsalsa CS-330]MDB9505155.1 chromate efflux transporter [Spirulina major CS-329]